MTYQFETDIAELYGVDEAIMIANLQFWIRKNEANGKHFHDGRYWTYNSIEAFTKLFPFWTARQVRRVLKSLEDKGVIITGNYNTSAYDRTTWYAFADSFLQKGQKHFTERANGEAETGKCIINNDADINPNSNPNIPADGGLFEDQADFKPVVVTAPRGTSEQSSCLFANSRFANFELFKAQFTSQEFQGVDIAYYYGAVSDWSASNGAKKKDWIATVRNFIRHDKENKKVHMLQGGLSHDEIDYLKEMADLDNPPVWEN